MEDDGLETAVEELLAGREPAAGKTQLALWLDELVSYRKLTRRTVEILYAILIFAAVCVAGGIIWLVLSMPGILSDVLAEAYA